MSGTKVALVLNRPEAFQLYELLSKSNNIDTPTLGIAKMKLHNAIHKALKERKKRMKEAKQQKITIEQTKQTLTTNE